MKGRRFAEVCAMLGTLETLSGAVVDWLTREERELTRVMDRGSDTVVAERLEIWKQRLQAYERLESALAQHQAKAEWDGPGGLTLLSETVRRELRLVS